MLLEENGELSAQGYVEKLKKGAGNLQCRADAKLAKMMKKETFPGAYRDLCRKLLRLCMEGLEEKNLRQLIGFNFKAPYFNISSV